MDAPHPKTFHLVVASVGENRFDGAAVSATIPTTEGEITILANHDAIIATLAPGMITVRTTIKEPQTFPIQGGILECANNRAVVLL